MLQKQLTYTLGCTAQYAFVGLQFDDFPFVTKNEDDPQPPAAAFGFCVGVKTEHKIA
jgi:hypothetical protein